MVAVSQRTSHVSGLPAQNGAAGGDPGPFTAMGIYHGIRAAVRHRLGKDSLSGVHIAIQGTGSVGGGLARLLAKDGAKLTLADIDPDRAARLANDLGAHTASSEAIMGVACDVFSPNALADAPHNVAATVAFPDGAVFETDPRDRWEIAAAGGVIRNAPEA